jgi:glycosyltransferase involved in cell wall biosynthesis
MVAQAKRWGADLLHSPYLAAPVLKRMPVVVTAHDMIPWVLPGYGGSGAVRLYFALAVAGAKRADLIIADSEASRRDAIRVLKVPASRVRTVYLGVEPAPSFSQEQLDEVRSRHGLPRDFSFYLGGFDRRKNVPLLLRAWRGAQAALCAEWCAEEKPVLAIGGSVPAPGGIFPDVRGVARRLGMSTGQVRFLGPVSEEDKPLLMAAARLFVYPSAYEGFGLDPLEAMSVGCPVLSSSGGSLPEVVGDAGLLVPPGDERALCEGIVRAWRDDDLRARLAEMGRKRAHLFTWDRTADQTFALYRHVLKRKRR